MQDKWSIRDVADALAKHGLIEKQTEQQSCDDAISRQTAIEAFQMFREYYSNRSNKEWVDRIETVLNKLPPVNPLSEDDDYFARWVAEEIFDDNWEYNKEAFAELACRKLAMLGIVVRMGDEWELVEPQENQDRNNIFEKDIWRNNVKRKVRKYEIY